MKKMFLLLAFLGHVALALADWSSYGCHFVGAKPSRSRAINGVHVFYNGTLAEKRVVNGVHIWECTEDICVAFPKDYKGPQMVFISTGGGSVQIQYQK